MKGFYEKKTFEWFVDSIFRDYWHFLRYYFVAAEDCPRCQDNKDAESDGGQA